MANSIVQTLVMVGMPVAVMATLALLFILAVYLFFFARRDKPRDALLELFREMVELAVINYEPHMLYLYRTPSEKGTEGSYPTVFKGKITGYNRINLYTSFEELYQPVKNDKDNYVIQVNDREFKVPKDEADKVKKLIAEAGNFLNVIVYEIEKGWKIPYLVPRIEVHAMLCFDDQVSGLGSIDGKVILHAVGTESHGLYFEIPSGSKDRTKVVVGVVETLTWIRMNSISLSNIFNVSDQALKINPAFNQLLSYKYAEQPTITNVQK